MRQPVQVRVERAGRVGDVHRVDDEVARVLAVRARDQRNRCRARRGSPPSGAGRARRRRRPAASPRSGRRDRARTARSHREHARDRRGAQAAGDVAGRAAELRRDAAADADRRRERARGRVQLEDEPAAARLHRRRVIEPLRGGRREQRADRRAARRLAGDHHVRRITAERRDVALHPRERRDLIAQAPVAVAAVGRRERGSARKPSTPSR